MMKTIYTSVLLAVLTATIRAAPAPIPREAYDPNPHNRSYSVILNGASGEPLETDLPDPNYEGVSFNSGFSVTSISGTDEYFQVTVYGSEGSVSVVSNDDTVAVGPPQPQISAFCQIVCPE